MIDAGVSSRIPLEDYARLLGQGEIEELRALAKPLRGRTIEMINSTAVGGGVAEILCRLLPLAEELELNIKWDVLTAAEDFFEVTKAFHNALHGAPYHATARDFEIYAAYNERNRTCLPLDATQRRVRSSSFIAGSPPVPGSFRSTSRPPGAAAAGEPVS